MKQFLTFTILSILILGCSSPKSETNEEPIGSINEIASSEILFQVKTSDKEDLEIFEDGIIPWMIQRTPLTTCLKRIK